MKNAITKKPWGYEKLIYLGKKFVVKFLYMKANKRCSVQYHKKKLECLYVLSGKGVLKIYNKKEKILRKKILKKYSHFVLKPFTIHRVEATTNLTYLECSTPELKDVIRLQDDYRRL